MEPIEQTEQNEQTEQIEQKLEEGRNMPEARKRETE